MATPPLAPRPAERRSAPIVHTNATPLLEPEETDARPVIRAARPDAPHVRAPRLLGLAGELVAAFAIIAGARCSTAGCRSREGRGGPEACSLPLGCPGARAIAEDARRNDEAARCWPTCSKPCCGGADA